MIKLELVGYCPHVKEDATEPKEIDLRESGWLFGRLKGNLHVLFRIQFGIISAIHMKNFNATVSYGKLRPGLPLSELARETTSGRVEIADFVASDGEVALKFLKGTLPQGSALLHPKWATWQLARLLQAGKIAGTFDPIEGPDVRPIL